MTVYILLALLLLMPYGDAFAKKSTGLYLGGGVTLKRNYRIGNEASGYDKDNITNFVPYAFYRSARVQFEGFFGSYNLVNSKLFALGPAYQFHGEKFEASGVEDRSATVMPGLFMRLFLVNFYLYKDVFGDSDGTVQDIFMALPFQPTSSWRVIPRVGITLYDESYVDHYYGISQTEAANSTFTQYQGKSGHKLYFALGNNVNITKSIMTKFSYGYELYSGGIYDSPTVYKRMVPTASFFLLFKI
jgi:outer membrane scaffolding protein for murein synthesis (MipA/OmpV family)